MPPHEYKLLKEKRLKNNNTTNAQLLKLDIDAIKKDVEIYSSLSGKFSISFDVSNCWSEYNLLTILKRNS